MATAASDGVIIGDQRGTTHRRAVPDRTSLKHSKFAHVKRERTSRARQTRRQEISIHSLRGFTFLSDRNM